MKNELYLGDCLEIMMDIPDNSIDAIICDLPYQTTNLSWDVIVPFDKLWEQYNRIAKGNAAIVLFGQEPFSSKLRMSNQADYKYDIYWEKERLTNIFQVKRRPGKVIETISIFYKSQPTYNPQKSDYSGPKRTNKVKDGKIGKVISENSLKVKEYEDTGKRNPLDIVRFGRDILKSNLHPTQKPLALCEYLIKTFSNEGDLVLDNCMGSGTACLAAKNLNRQFIGIEKDAGYFEIAKKRIEE